MPSEPTTPSGATISGSTLGKRDDVEKTDAQVAYVAGDHRIVFPATVALKSLEEHSPGAFRRIICFDGSQLTSEHEELFDRYGIEFLDARTVPDFRRVKEMPLMNEGRWPAEVFLNWALPEHLATLGYRYSLKLDYDVVCVESVTPVIRRAIRLRHQVAYRKLKPYYRAASSDIADEFIQRTGLPYPSSHRINVGVAHFDNAALAKAGYFEKFLLAYQTLMEISPEVTAAEQVALAAVSEAMEGGCATLPASMNRFARPFKSAFEPEQDMKIVHFNGDLKPWKVLDERHENMAKKRGQVTPLLMRELWWEQAKTIDGFNQYTEAKPATARQLLTWTRRLEKELHSPSASGTR